MDTKRLHELMPLPGLAQQWADVCVHGVSSDSRQVKQGDLFITCLGEPKRQRSYIEQAQAKGAAAVAIDAEQVLLLDPSDLTVPIIPVPNLAQVQGHLAAKVMDDPSHTMALIGITGTNGKTSCSQFIAQCFDYMGGSCGVMGTLGYGLLGQLQDGPNTTPDQVTMQSQLGAMVDSGAQACAIEVSSHGLHQGRLQGCRFNTAVFTNLTRDHLDYHGSMQAYGAVKSELFKWPGLRHCVVNFDDDFGRGLLNEIAPSTITYTYSAEVVESAYVDLGVEWVTQHKHGIEAMIITPVGNALLRVGLIGRFNLSNLLATLGVLLLQNVDLGKAIHALEQLTTVCGRMELISSGHENAQAIVDYAHTPDALEQALMAAKEHVPEGKLWVVFGCGGDRDKGKRPQMAAIAQRWADHIIVTDDNPRTESGEAILADICAGFSHTDKVEVIADRAQAIALAMSSAKPNDLVVIAGKGHETYQDVQGHKHHFSDQEQALLGLKTNGNNTHD